MSETTVTGEPLERWTISVPKAGGPTKDAIQGTPAFVFHLSTATSDILEENLRRVNKGTLRRGVPLLYRGDRELEPEKAEAEEDRQLLSVQTSTQDPAEAGAAYEVLNLKDLRRQLVIDVEARRRELEGLKEQIAKLGARLETETERQDRALAAQLKHNQKLVEDARAHYEKLLTNNWELQNKLEEQSTAQVGQIGQQMAIVTEGKRQLNAMMRSSTAADLYNGIKENVTAALNSPIGQQIGGSVAASVAAMVNTKLVGRRDPNAKPIDKEDVTVAFVLQGREYRERTQMLLELKLQPGINPVRAEAALLGAQFAAGAVEVRVLAEFIARAD